MRFAARSLLASQSGRLAPLPRHRYRYPTGDWPTQCQGLSLMQINSELIRHSPLGELGNSVSRYRLSPLFSSRYSRYFLLVSLYHHKHIPSQSQWAASEKNPRNVPCVWPTPHLVAPRYDHHPPPSHPQGMLHADTTSRTVTGGPMSSGSTFSASTLLPATLSTASSTTPRPSRASTMTDSKRTSRS